MTPVWPGVLDSRGIGIATAGGDVLVVVGGGVRRHRAVLALDRDLRSRLSEVSPAPEVPTGPWTAPPARRS
ncbi:hypothetical protein GCM10009821_07110 [Aeromicrobium halocynthiae]|uniref:Uncharacterized protein n=1 Tax=Aeromicrobium halocynthiae TaxID=560557 RepID=A0ABN2VT93_9ACTN